MNAQLAPITDEEYAIAIKTAESFAAKMSISRSHFEEMKSAALYGVAIAGQRYDRTHNKAFALYAWHYIRKYAFEAARQFSTPLTSPRNRNHGYETVSIEEYAEAIAAPTSDELPDDEKEAVYLALATLPAKESKFIRLYYLQGKTQVEAAQLCGYSKGYASSIKQSASKKFKHAYSRIIAGKVTL